MRRFLRCAPEFFAVEYSINPYMNPAVGIDRGRAKREWDTIGDVLGSLGVALVDVAPVPELPDMCFAANAALVWDGRALLANPRCRERQPEISHYRRWFVDNGFDCIEIPGEIAFEGAGDVIVHGQTAIFTYGPRTMLGALALVREAFPTLEIRASLELVDTHFYHGGNAVSVLGPDAIMYYPGAFSESGRAALESAFRHRIEVGEDDARNRLALNAIVHEGVVVLNDASQELEHALIELDLRVIRCATGEFLRSGGAVRCLHLAL